MDDSSKSKNNALGQGCLVLFALPFAGVGVFMVILTVWTLVDWYRMQSWVETPANLLEARLEQKHDDDGTTYLAVARYTYIFEGRQYQGDRVGIDTTSDNIGNYHERKVNELQQQLRSEEPILCFVNSSSPDQSVLFRELRFEKIAFYLLFALIFGGAGFAMIAAGIYAQRKQRVATALQAEFPEQAWKWRQDWSEGSVRSSSKVIMLFAVFFASMWNLISAPVLFIVPGEVQKENYLALIGLIFPVVGIGLAVWAIISVRRWMKFGESVFAMASVPGVIGGPLAGVIHTTVKLQPEHGFRQTLSCIRKVTTGSGKNRSTREHVLWQTTRNIQREMADLDVTKSEIPVQFHIPFDAQEASSTDDRCRVFWRLEVDADSPGVDYHAVFEVPVFRTAESSADYRPDESAIASYVGEPSIADVYRQSGVRRLETIRGLRIEFPLFRHFGATMGLTTFLVVWVGFIVLMLHLGAPILFPLLFGFFALLFSYFAVEMWFWRSTLEVDSHGITLRAGLVGLAPTRQLMRNQIRSISIKSGMQSGRKLYHDLQITTTDGKTYFFGKRVPNQPAAKAIADDVRQALGMASEEQSHSESGTESTLGVGV